MSATIRIGVARRRAALAFAQDRRQPARRDGELVLPGDVGLGLADRAPDGDGRRRRHRIVPLGLAALGRG